MNASPYSTGGGGTVLEHWFGATLLARMLSGDAIPGLGDDVTPRRIAFQCSSFSAVDDIVVDGRTADGDERRLSIGVRRSPRIIRSDVATRQLISTFVRTVEDHWQQVASGHWRLALVATSPNSAIQQLDRLAVVARSAPDECAFRQRVVAGGGYTDSSVRNRLSRLDAMRRVGTR